MAFMEWSTDLEVGQGAMDADHRTLLNALNGLQRAVEDGQGREEIDTVLRFLRDYTVSHFSMEESLMLRHRFPGASAHFADHSALVMQVSDLMLAHRARQVEVTGEVLELLRTWLQDHIQGKDRQLGEFLQRWGRGVTA
jgi:hemerythrin